MTKQQGIAEEFGGQLEDEELFDFSKHKDIRKMEYVEIEDDG